MTSHSVDEASVVRRLLLFHVLGAACLGGNFAIQIVLPFLARQRFGATNWQTAVLTAAVPVTQFFTIFWHHVYARLKTKQYLLIIGILTSLPIALIGQARSIWEIMLYFVVASLGGGAGTAAMSPLNADLLRSCYPPQVRGRVFGMVCAVQFAAAMLTGLAIGFWFDRHDDGFRSFFPIMGGIMATGLFFYSRICRHPRFAERHTADVLPGGSWWTPLREMAATLRRDRRFAGYEAAFMSYGIGWMICTALVPVLATDRLRLDYTRYSQATVVFYQLTNFLLLVPMGRIADRIGPVRLASISFVWLAIYPLGLLAATNATWLCILSVIYAMGMVGVQLTWTLGPVSLAPDPSRAPEYLAIHGTLVGVRGIIAQGLGMAIYSATGRLEYAFVLAAIGFVWASWLMRRVPSFPSDVENRVTPAMTEVAS